MSECHGEEEEDDSRAGDLESPTVAPNYSSIGSMIYQRHSLSPSFLFRSPYICFHCCDILIVSLFSIGSGKRRFILRHVFFPAYYILHMTFNLKQYQISDYKNQTKHAQQEKQTFYMPFGSVTRIRNMHQ